MPNWTSNHVTIKGNKDDIKKIKELLTTQCDDGTVNCFDFNKIIPMPESLQIDSGSITQNAMRAAKAEPNSEERKEIVDKMSNNFPWTLLQPYNLPNRIENEDDFIKLGELYLDNIKKYGHPTWYEWRCENWGVKWNTHEPELKTDEQECLEYEFDTAWNEPVPIFVALSEQFPNITINTRASYEDPTPWEIICTEYENGEVVENHTETDEDMKKEYALHCEDDE